MLFNDVFVAAIYIVLILVFMGVGYSVLPKDFKKLLKKLLKLVYQKVFVKHEKSEKKEDRGYT